MSRIEHCCKNLVANCFRNFFKEIKRTVRKCIEKIATIAKITNSIRIANRSKFFSSQVFVAILAKIWLIEIACRNKKKSAKIAKVTKKFHCTKKNTQITIARISRITK